jgi:SAM-dependent methyltransferase
MIGPDPYRPEADVFGVFQAGIAELRPKRVLEVGTRRVDPDKHTHAKGGFPWVADEDYVMLDVRGGIDVDVVGDLHALPEAWTGRFDCFIACAVFEHLERPWVAAREVSRILAPGGLFFVLTHQCWPIHGHPSDFFRFSKQALRLIFEDAGLVVEAADYAEQCLIVPAEHLVPYAGLAGWNREFPSYVHVMATGRKP